jgi:ABC-type Fe3+/spermidine/putrescine transport system ATPase subunit
VLQLDALGTTLTAEAPDGQFQVGDQVTLVVRPEMIETDAVGGQVKGLVRRATYLGNVVEYDVEVEGQLLSLVEYDPRHTVIYDEGATVWLRFLEDCLYVLPRVD